MSQPPNLKNHHDSKIEKNDQPQLDLLRQKLQEYREAVGKDEDFCKQFGLSRQAISFFINGSTENPRKQNLRKFAEVLEAEGYLGKIEFNFVCPLFDGTPIPLDEIESQPDLESTHLDKVQSGDKYTRPNDDVPSLESNPHEVTGQDATLTLSSTGELGSSPMMDQASLDEQIGHTHDPPNIAGEDATQSPNAARAQGHFPSDAAGAHEQQPSRSNAITNDAGNEDTEPSQQVSPPQRQTENPTADDSPAADNSISRKVNTHDVFTNSPPIIEIPDSDKSVLNQLHQSKHRNSIFDRTISKAGIGIVALILFKILCIPFFRLDDSSATRIPDNPPVVPPSPEPPIPSDVSLFRDWKDYTPTVMGVYKTPTIPINPPQLEGLREYLEGNARPISVEMEAMIQEQRNATSDSIQSNSEGRVEYVSVMYHEISKDLPKQIFLKGVNEAQAEHVESTFISCFLSSPDPVSTVKLGTGMGKTTLRLPKDFSMTGSAKMVLFFYPITNAAADLVKKKQFVIIGEN